MAREMLSPSTPQDPRIASYIEELRKARWAARMVAILHSLSRFLAFCNLTWATVVLLGAFVSEIHMTDYFSICFLLVFEAFRLASTAFFTQLFTRFPDSGHSGHPNFCQIYTMDGPIPNPKDDPLLQEHMARLLFAPLLQVLVIVSSFNCSIIRLLNMIPLHDTSHFTRTLHISLRIFYSLVVANAIISALALLCSIMAWICLKNPYEQSVLRYYDEVLENACIHGVLKADTFNFFQFAFRTLGKDHVRYKGWAQVVKAHKKMLLYLYAHKQGADYLQICLDSEDASVRKAAANTVGVWAGRQGRLGLGLGLPEFQLQPELLTKLADMVGMGEVGWAVIQSFGALAKRNPQILLQTLTSSKQPVLHRLAELVNGSSTRSLAVVRTLVLFYNEIYLLQQFGVGMEATGNARPAIATGHGTVITKGTELEFQPATGASAMTEAELASGAKLRYMRDERYVLPEIIENDLVSKLKQLLESSRLHRLRIQSAYLLYLLGKLDADPCHDYIRAINPSKDWYWYEMEKEMLEFFLANMPPSAASTPSVSCYPRNIYPDEEDILPPPWHPQDAFPLHHTSFGKKLCMMISHM